MMCATMASRAERDQVFLRISTQVASEFLVVYFQVRHSAAGLRHLSKRVQCTEMFVPAVTPLKITVIVAVPTPVLVASPLPFTTATAGLEEFHIAPNKLCVLLSLNVPVAISCCVVPRAMLWFAGETAIELRVAPVTVICAVLVTDPSVAVSVEDPALRPDTIPV